MFKMLTVINTTLILASVGGYEHEMFGLAGMFIRMTIFLALAVFFALADELSAQRKRAKRAATHLTQIKN